MPTRNQSDNASLSDLNQRSVEFRHLKRQPYADTWQAMRTFTDERDAETNDQIWLLQHDPVYTLGQAGKSEHILGTSTIPIVQSDRGGQVTYHGPGQLIAYTLLDIRRRGLGVRELVVELERSVINLLASHGISASGRRDAPGVYVGERKIAALGLRIRRGCSYHGLALNVNMDLSPFSMINPCGYAGLQVTSTQELGMEADCSELAAELQHLLNGQFG